MAREEEEEEEEFIRIQRILWFRVPGPPRRAALLAA